MSRSWALAFLAWACAGQHAWYSWPPAVARPTNLSATLVWVAAQEGNVYLATQFWTPCAGGYFGGQMHVDGTHSILFSIWDGANATSETLTQPVAEWCSRFGGEGTGAQCGLLYHWDLAEQYEFRLTPSAAPGGTKWTATVTPASRPQATSVVGEIFVPLPDALRAKGETCGTLAAGAVSFQEYYTGGQFFSAAGWVGPRLDGVPAAAAAADCASPLSKVSACIPGVGCGAPNVLFEQGAQTPHGCPAHLWNASTGVAAGHYLGPIHRRPTDAPRALFV